MRSLSLLCCLSLAALVGCSGASCGALKRLMYETPGRDAWQKPDEVVAALALEPGDHVADLGAGGGYFTFPIARVVGESGRVHAVDVDPALLAYVERQAREREMPWITTVHTAEDRLELPEDSVDLIFLANVFHHLPEPSRYFAQARRALRAGGRVAVVETQESRWLAGHATPAGDIRRAFEAAGYALAQEHALLEHQSFQIFVPAAASDE